MKQHTKQQVVVQKMGRNQGSFNPEINSSTISDG